MRHAVTLALCTALALCAAPALAQVGVTPLGAGQAGGVRYTPAEAGDWSPSPESVSAALDQLAASGGGGDGDVLGPAASTDEAVCRFDGETGKLLQDSALGPYVSDAGVLSLDAGARADTLRQWATTPYVVGSASSVHGWSAPYTSIQAAVDAAAAVSTSSQPGLVLVLPGSYTGDVALARHVHVHGIAPMARRGVRILGTVTAAHGVDGVNRTNSRTGISSLMVAPPAGKKGIVFSGDHPQELYLENIKVFVSGNAETGLEITNGATDANSLTSTVYIRYGGNIQTTNSATAVVHSAGILAVDGSGWSVDRADPNAVAIAWSGTASYYTEPAGSLTVTGLITSTTAGNLTLSQLSQITNGGAAITHNGAGTLLLGLYGLFSYTPSATVPVQGAGVVVAARGTVAAIQYAGPIFASTLTGGLGVQWATDALGVLASADSASGVPYAPSVGGDWDPVPTTAAGALDQLAARESGGGAGDAADLDYTPVEPLHWDPVPAKAGPALDQLASREIPVDATMLAYTPGEIGDWDPEPSDVKAALDQLAAREAGGGGGGSTKLTLPGTPVVDWQPDWDATANLTISTMSGTPPSTARRNGRDVMFFGNTNVHGNAGKIGKTASFTVILVYRPMATGERRLTGSIGSNFSRDTWGYLEHLSGHTLRVQHGDGSAYGFTVTTAAAFSVGAWHVVSVVYTAGNTGAEIWVNGQSRAVAVSGTGATTAAGGVEGDFWWGRGGSGASNGFFGPLVVYQSAVSTEDREAVEAALAGAYGIELDPGE